MTITTVDQFKAASLSHSMYYKSANLPSVTASYFHSYWLANSLPAAGSISGSTSDFTLKDYTTTGALAFINSLGGSNQKYLFRLHGNATYGCTVTIYDRIADTAAITIANGTYSWTGNFTAVRPTTGEGHELFAEITTGMSGYAHTLTFTYLDTSDTSRTGTIVLDQGGTAGRFIYAQMYPSVGMKKVTGIVGSGNALSTGAFALVWVRRITSILLPAQQPTTQNYADLGFPLIYDNSCIATAVQPVGTSAPSLYLGAEFKEG